MSGIVNNKIIFTGLSFPIFLDISPSGFSVVTQAAFSDGVVVPLFLIYSFLVSIIFAKFTIIVGIFLVLLYSPLFFIFDLPLVSFAQVVLFFILFDFARIIGDEAPAKLAIKNRLLFITRSLFMFIVVLYIINYNDNLLTR